MKKTVLIILLMCLSFCLFGCEGDNKSLEIKAENNQPPFYMYNVPESEDSKIYIDDIDELMSFLEDKFNVEIDIDFESLCQEENVISADDETLSDKEWEEFMALLDETVYVTPYGKRYHYRKSCAGENATETTVSNAEDMYYTPCQKCS